MAKTAARVDMVISNNATWEDAFLFGTVGDTSWSFTNKRFLADIKGARDDPSPTLSLSSDGGTIVVDDVVQRLLHFDVDEGTIKGALSVTDDEPYVYDLVMVDTITNERVLLMGGKLCVEQGVTQT